MDIDNLVLLEPEVARKRRLLQEDVVESDDRTRTRSRTVTVTDTGSPLEVEESILFRLRIQKLAKVTVSIPLTSLLFCFVTAMVFQYKEVNQTVCRVFNVIPSISAITGISPQCYVWRIGVALHCAPRFVIALLYYDNYRCRVETVLETRRTAYLRWAAVAYWLNLVENASLIGVTYISNRDNYAIHEKIFICFMTSSMTYMFCNTVVFRWSRPLFTPTELKSFKWKIGLFVGTLVSSAGLLYFFYRHRRFCEEMAFSYFSFCEYCIAVCNMAYHMTLVWDFPEDKITVSSTRYGITMTTSALATATKTNSTNQSPKTD